MKTILETVQLEFHKSDFLIDLVKHSDGLVYVEIVENEMPKPKFWAKNYRRRK